MGRNTSTRRWRSIKRKYNVNDKQATCMPSEVVLRINIKERLKSEAVLIRHERIKTELIERLSTPKELPPAFFNFSKRNISYIESHQQSPKQASTPKHSKEKTSKSYWDCEFTTHKHRRRILTEHPIMEMYKSTSDNVVRSVRSNQKYDGPFDWFASFEDLHPY